MKLNTILAFLSIASTRAFESESDVMCNGEVSYEVVCGTHRVEFVSLCAAKDGGFEEEECSRKGSANRYGTTFTMFGVECGQQATFRTSVYKPVACTKEDKRQAFDNPCDAKTWGSYEESDCICDEYNDITYMLEKAFDGNCHLNTTAPEGENDAQVVFSCQNVLDETKEGTDSRNILEVILVATGIHTDAPTPDFFTIRLNEANQPSTTVDIPLNVTFGYRNDCTDFEDTRKLLEVYN